MKKLFAATIICLTVISLLCCGFACAESAENHELIFMTKHCPILPEPTSFTKTIYQYNITTRNANSKNPKVTYNYTSFPDGSTPVDNELELYLENLRNLGFVVKGNVIYAGDRKLATVSLTSTIIFKNTLEIEVVLGNENLTEMPVPPLSRRISTTGRTC